MNRTKIERILMIGALAVFWILVAKALVGCGGEFEGLLEEIHIITEEETVATPVAVATPEAVEGEENFVEDPKPTPKPRTPAPYVPENCENPPKHLSHHDGFKCKASETRGGSVVCLLPWQFTWNPYYTDSKGHLSSLRTFDSVYLVLKNGKQIDLKFAGFHNPVYLSIGKVNRQHWRNEGVQWDDIKRRAYQVVMAKGNKRTCLRF